MHTRDLGSPKSKPDRPLPMAPVILYNRRPFHSLGLSRDGKPAQESARHILMLSRPAQSCRRSHTRIQHAALPSATGISDEVVDLMTLNPI